MDDTVRARLSHASRERAKGKFCFDRPFVRKEKPEDETEVLEDWVEFVGDLVVVAFLFRLGEVMKHCGPSDGVLIVMPMFFIMYRTVLLLRSYINAIDTDGILRLLVMSVCIFGLFVMALNIQDGSNEGYDECVVHAIFMRGFWLGFALARGSIWMLYGIALIYIPDARGKVVSLYRNTIAAFVVLTLVTFLIDFEEPTGGDGVHEESQIMWLAADPIDPPAADGDVDTRIAKHPRLVFAGLCAVVLAEWLPELYNVFYVACGCWDGVRWWFLMHISHTVNRRNAFFMICLGEAVLALQVMPLTRQELVETWVFQTLSFLIVIGFALLNFNAHPHDPAQNVLRKSAQWSSWQSVSQHLLNFSIFLMGVGLKMELYALTHSAQDGHHRRLAAHKGWNELSAVGLMGLTTALSQLLLLVNEVAQRRKEMWATARERAKLALAVLCAVGQCGYFLFALATGRDHNLVLTDSIIHTLLIVPGIIMNVNPVHECDDEVAEAEATIGSQTPGAEIEAHCTHCPAFS